MTAVPVTSTAGRRLFQLVRIGFRLLPMPASLRNRLRRRYLARQTDVPAHAPSERSPEVPHAERRPRIHAAGRAVGYVSRHPGELPSPGPATLVAFYRTQSAPATADAAHGQDHSASWRNVTRALPQFEGHAQPRLPGELGFYDLRMPEVMRRQVELAREYGIDAFCCDFRWPAGAAVGTLPLEQWLADSSLAMRLCLRLVNDAPSRRRIGESLVGQPDSACDDLALIEHLSRYLGDPRYLRVDGRPLLLVDRVDALADAAATAMRWREWCRAHGLGEIRLACVEGHAPVDPLGIGFDVAVEFPPNEAAQLANSVRARWLNPEFRGEVHDWRELARHFAARPDPPYPCYPGVNAGWDTEPRNSGQGRVFAHASPRAYRDWLHRAIEIARRRFAQQPLVFINAWNAWEEGAVLEPDARLGYAWLQATREALRASAPSPAPPVRPCVVVHAWYPDVLPEIVALLRTSGGDWRVVITTTHEHAAEVRRRVAELALAAEIEVFENRGRDILPFLHVANRLIDEGADVVLKLHTKRSTHRQDGEQWRRELFGKLLSPERVPRILAAFRNDPALGIVYPEGHRQPLGYYWSANQSNVESLTARMGIDPPRVESDRFIAGSMFWCRLSALRPLLDAHLDCTEFEHESGQVDGTQAHAIERVFALASTAAGFANCSAGEISFRPGTPVPSPSTVGPGRS